MGSLIVDKRTLQVLIRAADQARKDLMDYNRSLQEKHLASPEGFAGKVREVRRIHDFLGRAGRSPEDRLSLDFALKERILLGSCLHHLKAQVDTDLRVPGLGKSQLRVLEESRTKINLLIAKMHAPGVSLLIQNGELSLNPVLDIDPDETTLDIDLTAEAEPVEEQASHDNFKLYNGSRFAFEGRDLSAPLEESPTELHAPAEGASSDSRLRLADLHDPAPGDRSDPPPPAPEPVQNFRGEELEMPSEEQEPSKRDPGSRPKGLFNPRMIVEPRIRTLARLDLADFQYAKKKQSLRRMLVHLQGCVEAVLLDHGLQNLDLYGLAKGNAGEWDFRALAHRIYSGKFDASQLQILDFLFKARDYLSAAKMYSTPQVLTLAMVQSAESLCRWMISELGYDQLEEVDDSSTDSSPKLWRSARR